MAKSRDDDHVEAAPEPKAAEKPAPSVRETLVTTILEQLAAIIDTVSERTPGMTGSVKMQTDAIRARIAALREL